MESNPEVMSKYMHNLGVPEKFQMVDIYGLETDMLSSVPRPVLSVLFLYPLNDNYEDTRNKEEPEMVKGEMIMPGLYYMKQADNKNCGTVALIHSIANNLHKIKLRDGELKNFIENTLLLTPEMRGQMLVKTEGINNIYKAVSSEEQCEQSEPNEAPDFHFMVFVENEGQLYELDGKRNVPLAKGQTSPGRVLEDAASVCQMYMARDPEELRFAILALVETEG